MPDHQTNQWPRNWSGADMRCPKCNKYLPDRCTCNGPSIEERRMTDHQTSPVGEDAERAAFEAWHRSKFATKYSTGQPTRDMHNGTYAEQYGPEKQQLMWEAWLAARRAAPTQPKAQVEASIDTPEFRMLEADFVKESVELSTKDHHADNTGLYAARCALIAHIDAWAGSRAEK